MLKLFHAPNSRSSRIVQLIDELDIWNEVEIQITSVPRRDGSGGRDPANPHPEGKVPFLVHDGVEIWESNAIILYLTELFPKPGFAPVVGDAARGSYLSWLAWYGNVMEPVIVHKVADLSHPALDATFRGYKEMVERLHVALSKGPFLLGEQYSAADLIAVSPFTWFPPITPDDPVIKAWVGRCLGRPSMQKVADFDQSATV